MDEHNVGSRWPQLDDGDEVKSDMFSVLVLHIPWTGNSQALSTIPYGVMHTQTHYYSKGRSMLNKSSPYKVCRQGDYRYHHTMTFRYLDV